MYSLWIWTVQYIYFCPNVFRSRKKCSTTYAIVLFFFLFFFSRPFHENFKFLNNCPYDFHEFWHSHSTPKGAPACAKASKSYGWDVRNIAKISPKMTKKTVIFRLFSIFSKTVHTLRTKFSTVIFYTIIWSCVCTFIKFV